MKVLKWLRNILLALIGFGLLLYFFGPYENADLQAQFDASQLDDGVSAYLAAQEAKFDNITPGVEKRVVWFDAPEAKTEWAVLYLHGFSATSQEIRPVPDQVADGLKANLVMTRLAGHGQDGTALAEATVADWMADVAEGLAVARAVGQRILIVSTSTGGTLAVAAANDEGLSKDVAGIVLVSPNFAINNPLAPLLTWPAARYWLPALAGAEREFEPHNSQQGQFWTTKYPSVAVMPMAALVKKVGQLDLSTVDVPALFVYSDRDQVVRPDVTASVTERWGGPVTVLQPQLGAGDDPSAHVIAGDIMSPGQTEVVATKLLEWAKGL